MFFMWAYGATFCDSNKGLFKNIFPAGSLGFNFITFCLQVVSELVLFFPHFLFFKFFFFNVLCYRISSWNKKMIDIILLG